MNNSFVNFNIKEKNYFVDCIIEIELFVFDLSVYCNIEFIRILGDVV